MKVLITMYDINNPGGIINHNENLIAGLKELGHEVDFVELLWRERSSEKRVSDKTGFEEKHSGYPVHQGKGWLFPVQKRIPYKGREKHCVVARLRKPVRSGYLADTCAYKTKRQPRQ